MMRSYCTSLDCPYHDECNKSVARLRGQWGWAVMVDFSGVCRKYIGWVYEQIGEMDENSRTWGADGAKGEDNENQIHKI